MQRRQAQLFGLAGIGAPLAGGATWRAYSAEMMRARARIRGRSVVFQGRFGATAGGRLSTPGSDLRSLTGKLTAVSCAGQSST